MGSGSTRATIPAAPAAAPALTDQAIQLARGSALRQISAKRGLASTFLTSGGSLNDTPTSAAPLFTLGGSPKASGSAGQINAAARSAQVYQQLRTSSAISTLGAAPSGGSSTGGFAPLLGSAPGPVDGSGLAKKRRAF